MIVTKGKDIHFNRGMGQHCSFEFLSFNVHHEANSVVSKGFMYIWS
jgi:hypothetical protein